MNHQVQEGRDVTALRLFNKIKHSLEKYFLCMNTAISF